MRYYRTSLPNELLQLVGDFSSSYRHTIRFSLTPKRRFIGPIYIRYHGEFAIKEKLLKKKEPIKLNKKCKQFCEGWYTSDSRCACGEKKIGIRDINLEYLNFTILDSKPSGELYCF